MWALKRIKNFVFFWVEILFNFLSFFVEFFDRQKKNLKRKKKWDKKKLKEILIVFSYFYSVLNVDEEKYSILILYEFYP